VPLPAVHQQVTQHDVNMLLNKRPGKLQTKDIKVGCAWPKQTLKP